MLAFMIILSFLGNVVAIGSYLDKRFPIGHKSYTGTHRTQAAKGPKGAHRAIRTSMPYWTMWT